MSKSHQWILDKIFTLRNFSHPDCLLIFVYSYAARYLINCSIPRSRILTTEVLRTKSLNDQHLLILEAQAMLLRSDLSHVYLILDWGERVRCP